MSVPNGPMLLAQVEELSGDMLRIAGDDHLVHKVIERASRIGLPVVALPHRDAARSGRPREVEDVLDARAERIGLRQASGLPV